MALRVITINAAETIGTTTSSGNSLGVSPAIMEMVLTPGETVKKSIKIFNNSNRPLPIKASVRDFLPVDDIVIDESVSAKSWVQIEPADFILEPQKVREILLTISPPLSAEPGGHYASIFLNPVLPEGMGVNGPQALARISVSQLFLVKGEIREKMVLERILAPSLVWGKKDIPIEISLKNEGNVHSLPRGGIVVFKDGKAEESLALDSKIVLPRNSSKIELAFQPKRFGKYRLVTNLSYGAENRLMETKNLEIIVLPDYWQIILVVCLTVVLFWVIIKRERLFKAAKILLNKK